MTDTPKKEDALYDKAKHKHLKEELTHLENVMHDADQFRTLDEQVTEMKRRGVDPHESYKDWDDKDEWADNADDE